MHVSLRDSIRKTEVDVVSAPTLASENIDLNLISCCHASRPQMPQFARRDAHHAKSAEGEVSEVLLIGTARVNLSTLAWY